VPATTRVLIDEGSILGVVNLRHRLTDGLRRFGGHVGYSVRPAERRRGHGTTLLRAAMEMARERGTERLLVTCHRGNVASAGVIVKCGGRLEDCRQYEAIGEVCRYWIDLANLSA
jgi:predicted acetyltransferase